MHLYYEPSCIMLLILWFKLVTVVFDIICICFTVGVNSYNSCSDDCTVHLWSGDENWL